jgi:hypothetical protein
VDPQQRTSDSKAITRAKSIGNAAAGARLPAGVAAPTGMDTTGVTTAVAAIATTTKPRRSPSLPTATDTSSEKASAADKKQTGLYVQHAEKPTEAPHADSQRPPPPHPHVASSSSERKSGWTLHGLAKCVVDIETMALNGNKDTVTPKIIKN